MSIFEVTNLDTSEVEIVEAKDEWDLRSYFTHIKIATLDPTGCVQVSYYLSGDLHSYHGPAVIWNDGHKEWWLNGNLHNEHGPAVVYANGHKSWWIKDKLHNEHGPAIVHADGSKEWWINDKQLTEEEFNEYLRSH